MDIKVLTPADWNSAIADNAGKFTLAVNAFIPNSTSTTKSITTTCWTAYITAKDGSFGYGLLVGGNNSPVMDVQPQYFPVATKGAECGAVVSNLAWADNNLSNYEFVHFGTGKYFVTGVLNSSQTQANDPFDATDSPGITTACCWAGNYKEGLSVNF